VEKRLLAAGRRHGIGSISFFHTLQRVTAMWGRLIPHPGEGCSVADPFFPSTFWPSGLKLQRL